MILKTTLLLLFLVVAIAASWYVGVMFFTIERKNKKIQERFQEFNSILQFIIATTIGFIILYLIFAIVNGLNSYGDEGSPSYE